MLSRTVIALLTVVVVAPPLWSQTRPNHERTVQDGVFTAEQADRGQKQYESFCVRCHGRGLTGANARALVGEPFLRNWTGLTLDGLLERAETMPPGAAESLETETYVDIITYVLQKNGYPAGEGELRADALPTILVEGEDGPQAAPDNTLVQVVGCLKSGPTNTWMVTDATEPVRTRDPAASVGDARVVAETAALGSGSYELMYVFPAPDGLVGHRVEAKGFLIRGDQDKLNVTALESVGASCAR